jgi:hypothetical protein
MKILEKGTQFNAYSVLVELDDKNAMRLQFPDVVSDSVALAKVSDIVAQNAVLQAYNAIETISFDLFEHIELLKEFIVKIKATPNINLTQYNTWLGTKQWYQAAIVRYFVFTLAMKLSNKKSVTLANFTETTVLTALRNWIVATDLKTIGKVVGYGIASD